MKKKPPNRSGEQFPNIKQAAEEAGLPERIKLPRPVQLATIAAGFGGRTHPQEAVKKAVSLYLRATAFKAMHDNAHVLDVASACDAELASQLSNAALKFPFNQTFLLEPDKPDDEVRRELAKGGLQLRKPKSVLENLHDWHRLDHAVLFLQQQEISVSWNGKPVSLWGTPVDSKSDGTLTKFNAVYKAKCRMVTQREFDEQKIVIAKKHGWRELDYENEWNRDLASLTEYRADGRVVYKFPSHWLGELLGWKKSLKHTGGMKSRQKKLSSKNS